MKYNNLHTFYIFKLTSTYNIIIISYIYIFIWISYDLIAMSRLKNVIFSHKNSLKLTLNMRRNAKLYLLSWALCFMWTKNYSLHKKLKLWMKGPDWKDQKSSSKYNPFMFSLRIIYTLCLIGKKENRLREPTNRLILIWGRMTGFILDLFWNWRFKWGLLLGDTLSASIWLVESSP